MEPVIPQPPIRKVWPLMTPAERLAIWQETRLAWAHDVKDVIAHIEPGRDEGDVNGRTSRSHSQGPGR